MVVFSCVTNLVTIRFGPWSASQSFTCNSQPAQSIVWSFLTVVLYTVDVGPTSFCLIGSQRVVKHVSDRNSYVMVSLGVATGAGVIWAATWSGMWPVTLVYYVSLSYWLQNHCKYWKRFTLTERRLKPSRYWTRTSCCAFKWEIYLYARGTGGTMYCWMDMQIVSHLTLWEYPKVNQALRLTFLHSTTHVRAWVTEARADGRMLVTKKVKVKSCVYFSSSPIYDFTYLGHEWVLRRAIMCRSERKLHGLLEKDLWKSRTCIFESLSNFLVLSNLKKLVKYSKR